MGKISRIQLRGISRTPSDRMTQDGGVAESLNMYIEQEESAPALAPVDVTDELGLPDDLVADKVFIHKTTGYENIILYDAASGKLSACVNRKTEPFFEVGAVESLSIASVGNTVLISTENGVNYFLFKDGSYKPLGSQIPFPTIKFTAKHVDDVTLYERKQTSFSIEPNETTGDKSNFWLPQGLYDKEAWNKANADTERDPEEFKVTMPVNDVCKEIAGALYESAKKQKVFVDHVFVRYAVTLYDDTIVSSVPYLLSGGFEDPLFIRYTKESLDHFKSLGESGNVVTETYRANNNETLICKARYPYRIHARLMDDLQMFDEWKDLIKSIDIYVSEKQEPRFDEIFATTCQQQGTGEYAPYYSSGHGDPIVSQGMTYYEWLKETKTYLFLSVGGPVYQQEFINRQLNKSLFFKLESIGFTEKGNAGYSSFVRRMEELREGSEIKADEYFENYDALVARNEILKGDDMIHSEILWSSATTLNNSLIVSGVYENLGTGSTLMAGAAVDIEAMTAMSKDATLEGMFSNVNPALLPPENYTVTTPLTYTYIIEENGVEYVVRGRNEKGETLFVDNDFSYYGWVVFPHRNCKKVIVGTDYGYYQILSMKQHPMLDCSYAYTGLANNIAAYVGDWGDEIEVPSENRRIDKANRIYVTTMDNPFYYPKEGIITFQSRVLGVAIASTALSQGQFGQFPLYVFTEDGIWAMETAADGSFVTSKPLSRDVCINPDSITSIDSAVVFVTDKGVMLLQGSQVVDISPNMNGRHYTIEETAKVILEKTIEDTIAKISKTPVDQMAQVIQNEVSQSISQQETRASIERTAQSIIAEEEFFKDLLPILSDSTHFMAFVKDATIAYDYSGKRLVFIKKDEKYQYIYKIDTNTWHKTAYGIDMVAPINSYPKCMVQGVGENLIRLSLYVEDAYRYDDQTFELFYGEVAYLKILSEEQWREMFFTGKNIVVSVTEEKKTEIDEASEAAERHAKVSLAYEEEGKVSSTRIYNLSTPLDVESQTPTKGIIVTRPFDLEAPDVLKTITDIKIRGQYARGAVKFMLLGSMDGVNFYVIGTKRGKAWKLFRLIILADLDPTERVSWVDVIFEERFTNRLR